MSTLPWSSTAMQKLEVGQDNEFTESVLSILVGLDQVDPFQLSALPWSSTAMQKLVVGQERR